MFPPAWGMPPLTPHQAAHPWSAVAPPFKQDWAIALYSPCWPLGCGPCVPPGLTTDCRWWGRLTKTHCFSQTLGPPDDELAGRGKGKAGTVFKLFAVDVISWDFTLESWPFSSHRSAGVTPRDTDAGMLSLLQSSLHKLLTSLCCLGGTWCCFIAQCLFLIAFRVLNCSMDNPIKTRSREGR